MSTSGSSSGSGSGSSSSGSTSSKIPITRRQAVIGTGGAIGAAALGGSAYGGSAIYEQLFGRRFLPGIDRDSFETEVDSLMDQRNNANSSAKSASKSFEEAGFSLQASDYRGRGHAITEDIRVAVPADEQSTHFEVEQGGDSRDFEWLDGTSSMGQTVEELVAELDEDVGLSEEDRQQLSNDELVSVATDMVPYIGSRINEDGSQGQPVLGDEQIEEFKGFMEDIEAAENAYSQALTELENASRELGQQKSRIKNADRAKVEGLFSSILPFAEDNPEYNQDEDYLNAEAEDMAAHIATQEEKSNVAYGEAVREFALVKAMRNSGEQVAKQLGIAQDIYEEGEFDASGESTVEDTQYDFDGCGVDEETYRSDLSSEYDVESDDITFEESGDDIIAYDSSGDVLERIETLECE